MNYIKEIGICIKEPKRRVFEYDSNQVEVVTFTLTYHEYDNKKIKKKYVNCYGYGTKINMCLSVQLGNKVEVLGYYKEKVSSRGMKFNNFVVESLDILGF